MNDKVRIGDHDDTAAEIKANAEEQRADNAVRELGAMKQRVRELYNEVQYISFADSDGAPSWAPKWLDYLLDGTVPEPVDPDVPVGEVRPEVEEADFEIVDSFQDEASGD